MVQAYNFLASWQLFPEKCNYENGIVPKNGTYKIESALNETALNITYNWVDNENVAYTTTYTIEPEDELLKFGDEQFAPFYIAKIVDKSTINVSFFDEHKKLVVEVVKEILSNGYLKVTQKFESSKGTIANIDIYHKQMSVLPYASSAGSVAIKPTKEGIIKHKALWAMEEQTNMQLNQIKEQIELLARQAQEIRKRKELSLLIYESKLSFKPQIGHTYHLYQKKDDTHILSLVAPSEWGGAGPFKAHISSVRLLADHTWMEV
jgi:hypothetical protein